MAAEREMKKVEDLTPQEREELRRFRDRLKSEGRIGTGKINSRVVREYKPPLQRDNSTRG